MKKIWFKRKLYGWGWYPITWQGWVVVLAYLLIIILFSLTLDENSNGKELIFTFFLPLIIITFTLIRICYKYGEKPMWQWGKRREDK